MQGGYRTCVHACDVCVCACTSRCVYVRMCGWELVWRKGLTQTAAGGQSRYLAVCGWRSACCAPRLWILCVHLRLRSGGSWNCSLLVDIKMYVNMCCDRFLKHVRYRKLDGGCRKWQARVRSSCARGKWEMGNLQTMYDYFFMLDLFITHYYHC